MIMRSEIQICKLNHGGWRNNRWWIYQRERFPLGLHGLLILIFSLAAVGYGHVLAGRAGSPAVITLLVSFTGSFITFLLLRIADEFKDYDDDKRYRPYRAVPRGLVKLSELAVLGVALTFIQLAVTLSFSLQLALPLLALWIYFLLMSREFFVPRWLKSQPVVYLVSHMLIMPLIALFASAPAWIELAKMPDGLSIFLVLTFLVGMVGEIGRKIRAPVAEEIGVETYSALWGRRRAVIIWIILLLLAGGFALQASIYVGGIKPLAIGLSVLLGVALVLARQLVARPKTWIGKAIETVSGLWALVIYACIASNSLDGLAWS
jgi:4-hydroxybenzoate polyprenyltransferase